MKTPFRLLFAFSLTFMIAMIACQGCFAESYYVSTTGSDETGSGTEGAPWATITHALDSVADGSLILVKPGTYNGRIRLRGQFDQGVTVRSEEAYKARLRHSGTVVTCFYGRGITLEGFDIAHSSLGGALVVQIQKASPDYTVSDIVIRNNVLHDSLDNDILKINNGAVNVTVEGNMFYNQTGQDEHIDANSVTGVVIQDNIFFNDFGENNDNSTSSFIVVKDSNGNNDGIEGSSEITIRRNIFMHWEGNDGTNFVLIGEDGKTYFEARDVLVENNLMLGDSGNVMRAAFGVKGGKDIVFRHNTVSGDLPSMAYAMRLNTENLNPPNENIHFFNNIWSDPTGTMGAKNGSSTNDFSDTPIGQTDSFDLSHNLYWNGGAAIPESIEDLINYTDDANRVVADPGLKTPSEIILPWWNEEDGRFEDGSTSIRQAFLRLVRQYGAIRADSAAVDKASSVNAAAEDILKKARVPGKAPDIGAFEFSPISVAPLSILLLD